MLLLRFLDLSVVDIILLGFEVFWALPNLLIGDIVGIVAGVGLMLKAPSRLNFRSSNKTLLESFYTSIFSIDDLFFRDEIFICYRC